MPPRISFSLPFGVALLYFFLVGEARADGGAPLLLLINSAAFVYGSIIIILVEWFLYAKLAGVPKKIAFFDAFLVNALSTIVVGFLFPSVIAGVTALGGQYLVKPFGDVFISIGTWLYEGVKYPNLSIFMTVFWLLITFLLTTLFEAKIIQKRWKKRSFVGQIDFKRLSLYSNSITYFGLFVFFGLMWLIFP